MYFLPALFSPPPSSFLLALQCGCPHPQKCPLQVTNEWPSPAPTPLTQVHGVLCLTFSITPWESTEHQSCVQLCTRQGREEWKV